MSEIVCSRISREEMKFNEDRIYEVEDYIFRLEYFIWEAGFLSGFEPQGLSWELAVFVKRSLQLLVWAESLPPGSKVGYEMDNRGVPYPVLVEEGF